MTEHPPHTRGGGLFPMLLGVALMLPACTEVASNPDSPGSGGANEDAGLAGSAGQAGAGGTGGNAGAGAQGGAAGGADAGAFTCPPSNETPDMVTVPAGAFIMGCNEAVDADCFDDERPMRTVTLSAFELDETEVTQGQFAACVHAGACDAPLCDWNCAAPDLPATCVTWDLAKMYCAWAGKRLPTEAEWEKAARGTDGRKYPWGNSAPTCAETNMSGCGEKVKPVGSATGGASPYGALDMAGNVVEMVADWYDATYYQTAPDVDPQGPLKGTRYVGRGGGYKSNAVWQRASSRDWYDTYDYSAAMGFRCAR